MTCSRCGKEGGSMVGGGDLPGVLCLPCVGELGIVLKWCCKSTAPNAARAVRRRRRKPNEVAMVVTYKGFEISAKREKALGGWLNLYFYIMRLSDGWFLCDSFTEGSDKVRDFIGYLKERVDNYLKDPKGECDEHPDDETCNACEHLRVAERGE